MKPTAPLIVGISLLMLLVLSCQKWNLDKAEFLQLEITSPSIVPADNSVQIEAHISDHLVKRIDGYGFIWTIDTISPILHLHPNRPLGILTQGKDTSFSATLPGFSSRYQYALAAYARVEDQVFYSDTVLFSLPPPGAVQILSLHYNGGNSLELNGQYVDSSGTLEQVGFCWSTVNEIPSLMDNFVDLGKLNNGEDTFSWTLENLEEGVTYHCRSYAIVRELGTTDTVSLYGNVVDFSGDLEGIWTPMRTFPGVERANAIAFTINDKGYAGGGIAETSPHLVKDFWEYDPGSDTWSLVDEFTMPSDSAKGVAGAASFSVGDKAYVATGFWKTVEPFITMDNNYSFDLVNGWEPKGIIEDSQNTSFRPNPRSYAVGFSIGEEGFFGLGFGGESNFPSFDFGESLIDLWKYDPNEDDWYSSKTGGLSPFPGEGRMKAVAFTVGGIAYVGTGKKVETNTYFNDFYAYDPVLDEWQEIAPLPGLPRAEAVAFSIGAKGYVAFGQLEDGSLSGEMFEYDPSANKWEKLPDFPGPSRKGAIAFSLNGKAYIGTGLGFSGLLNDFWVFNPN